MTDKERAVFEGLRIFVARDIRAELYNALDNLLDGDPYGPVTDEELDAARVDIKTEKRMSDGRTHYADDATIAYIAKLEAELAEAVELLGEARQTLIDEGLREWPLTRMDAFLARQEAKHE